jgi:flagellar protein FlaJ
MTDASRKDIENTSHRDTIIEDKQNYDTYENKTDQIAYRLFGDLFNNNKEFLDKYQKNMKGAHISIGSDLYLARVLFYTLVSAILIFFVTTPISLFLIFNGSLEGITETTMMANGVAIGFPILSVFLFAPMIGVLYYIMPQYKSSRRSSSLDATLPSAVTFMYALSRGGMNINQIMRMIAKNDEVYGEVSYEFGTVIQDMEYFSRDSLSALRRAGKRSPSQKFSDLMDDMVATLDSGAKMENFLEQKSEDLIEEAEREQKQFIEQLSLLGEVYVTAFVAGPLFMIIISVIMALLGGANPQQLDGIVYMLLPFMNVGYYFLINVISGSEGVKARKIPTNKSTMKRSNVELEDFAKNSDDERVKRVQKAKKKRERTSLIFPPYKESLIELTREPNKTAIFTAPIALMFLIFVVITGIAQPTFSAFIDAPVLQTVYWLLIPVYIILVPLMLFYEVGSRRERKMMNRFPDALKQIASANSVGMTLTESLETTAENTSGRLGDELMLVKNDIKWNNDVNFALIKFANRVQVPIITTTMKLITEANESTGDIEDVLSIASKNVETQVRLRKERNAAMIMYTAVILISYVVYLFVIALLDMMFLSVIEEMGAEQGSGGAGDSPDSEQFDVAGLNVDRFRLVFYHSTIVQAFGSGLISGYLSSNDIRSGIKFALVLCVVSSIIFSVI